MNNKRDTVWAGAAAGLAGGLVASFAMGFVHKYYAKATGSEVVRRGQDSTALAADMVSERVFDHDLTGEQRKVAGPAVHFAVGGSLGALYGVVSSAVPVVSGGLGLPFGAAVWAGAHATAVPKLGLGDSPMDNPIADEAAEFGAHLVYGLVTDLVRRLVLLALE